MKLKRLPLSLITGAILGIFCIIGLSVRMGYLGNELLIFATYINRVIMGLVIGLLPRIKPLKKSFARGALFGLIISGSLYISTNFVDTPGFFAGIVYGIIIDYVATKYAK